MPQQTKGGNPALSVSVGSLAIAAACRAVDAAWAFTLFAISPLGQAALNQGQFAQGQMPVYRTDAQVQAWLATAPANGGPGLKALLQRPWKLQPRYVDLPATPAAGQAQNQAIGAALSGKKTVDQAISDYQAALEGTGGTAP